MNQNEQMREALENAIEVAEFLAKRLDEDDLWNHVKSLKESLIEALAAEPAPLARLTDEDALELHRKSTEVWLAQDCEPRIGIIFANALQDAMIANNGGKP